MRMHAVEDETIVWPLLIQSQQANQSGIAMMEWCHGVEDVSKHSDSTVDSIDCRVDGGHRVAGGHDDPLGFQSAYGVSCPWKFWCNCDDAHIFQRAISFLKRAHALSWGEQHGLVVRAFPFRVDKWPLEMDAQHIGALELTTVRRRCVSWQDLSVHVSRRRHDGRTERRDPRGHETLAHQLDVALARRRVGKVEPKAAIQLHVDQARCDDAAAAVDDLVGRVLGVTACTPEATLRVHNLAVLHPEVRLLQSPIAQHAHIFELEHTHHRSPGFQQKTQSDCANHLAPSANQTA